MRKEVVALWSLPFVLLFVLEAGRWGPVKVVEAAVGTDPLVKLEWHFYYKNNACRYAETFIKSQVQYYYNHDRTIVPKLLRLLYSDCLVTVRICFLMQCNAL